MIHRIQAYFAGIKPVYIDGGLYVALAFLGAILITFNNDDVYKYSPWAQYKGWPIVVFWVKSCDEWLIAGFTALKMYRSTAYAEHLASKEPSIKVPQMFIPTQQMQSQPQQQETQQVDNKL